KALHKCCTKNTATQIAGEFRQDDTISEMTSAKYSYEGILELVEYISLCETELASNEEAYEPESCINISVQFRESNTQVYSTFSCFTASKIATKIWKHLNNGHSVDFISRTDGGDENIFLPRMMLYNQEQYQKDIKQAKNE